MIIGIIAGIAIISFLGFKHLKKQRTAQQSSTLTTNTDKIDQTIPDSAVGFGYKCMWFAIKTTDQQKIVELLKIKNTSKCNWKVGIDKAYESSVFITPAIDNWTLVCGLGLPTGDSERSIDEVKQILQELSKEFGEAQFFCTHRVIEFHCWIKATSGQITRVYSYFGEQGENLFIEGEPTEFEKKYKLINTFSEVAKDEKYFDNEELLIPNEQFLMKVADNWSIDPTQLDTRKDIPFSLGLIGER